MRRCLLFISWIWLPVNLLFPSIRRLPVFISDNHAGSFYFLAQTLDWRKDYRLLLIDRHPDTSSIPGSDSIREKLSERNAAPQLSSVLNRWRTNGSIQCYNWIEPLMPAPVKELVWIKPAPASLFHTHEYAEIRAQLDGLQDVFPRRNGLLSSRVRVQPSARLRRLMRETAPTVASIDLDYFTGLPEALQKKEINGILDVLLSSDSLEALTIAVSSPYLQSSEEAEKLLGSILLPLTLTYNCEIELDLFGNYGPDRSEKAEEYYRSRKSLPAFDPAKCGTAFRSLLVQRQKRLNVDTHPREWEQLLSGWEKELPLPRRVCSIDGKQQNPLMISVNQNQKLKLQTSGDNVRWFLEKPLSDCVNLTDDRSFFAKNSPGYLRYREEELVFLRNHPVLSNEDIREVLKSSGGIGTCRIFPAIEGHAGLIRGQTLSLSVSSNEGLNGSLEELFGLPYVLGMNSFHFDRRQGPDTLLGADCAGFLIYAKRRQGIPVPYGNPIQLLPWLKEKSSLDGRNDTELIRQLEKVTFCDEEMRKGIVLHLGGHVALLYRDLPPYGKLGANDLAAHHLGRCPEVIAVSELLRRKRNLRVMVFKE